MRRGTMRLQRGIVLILFIDKKPAGIGLVLVYLIHEAAGFFAGFRCKFFKDRYHFRLASGFCHPGYGQYHHLSLRSRYIGPEKGHPMGITYGITDNDTV